MAFLTLTVGDAFFRHDWRVAVNGWWSPLYPWVLGVFLGIVRPSPHHEFLLVHAFNFVVFAAALFAFRFLLHGFLPFIRGEGVVALPEWGLTLLGYATFLWISLEVVTVYDVGADLAVVSCYCLSLGILLRLHPDDGMSKFALFGLSLGIGYWTKSILFPLGFAALLIGYSWKRGIKRWRNGMARAGLVFIASAAPLILLLSPQKGRLTFGDSGRVNYAWAVSPRTPTRNWQGAEPGSGVPAHPTRQLMRHPPVFDSMDPSRRRTRLGPTHLTGTRDCDGISTCGENSAFWQPPSRARFGSPFAIVLNCLLSSSFLVSWRASRGYKG